MKIKNNIYKYLGCILLICASCGDKLNIDPKDQVDADKALKTSGDVEGLLVGGYNALADGDLLGGNLQRDAELMGDAGEIFWDGTFVAPQEIYDKNMLITNDQARQTWLDGYYCISIANLVLKNLNLVNEAIADRVEGEARFLRGVAYFELVRVYAKTYTDGNPSVNLGIPIMTENDDPKALLPRSTVQEVYDLVIDDLTQASSLLPDANNFFATNYAANAMLSRVYLMQNDYANARDYADAVIQSDAFSLYPNFDDAFNRTSLAGSNRDNNGNASKENIFEIQITSQDGVNNLNTFFASADFGGRGDIYIESNHFDMYEGGDQRSEMFYDESYTTKFDNLFGNVPIVRLSEMYLTRAEANRRLGTNVGDTPLNDVNRIRNRADLAPLGSVSVAQILQERRLELAFEGHQIHDLKRTQQNVGSMPYNDPKLIFPIPYREIIINSNLVQNESY